MKNKKFKLFFRRADPYKISFLPKIKFYDRRGFRLNSKKSLIRVL